MTTQYYGGSSNCYSHGQNTDYYADALMWETPEAHSPSLFETPES